MRNPVVRPLVAVVATVVLALLLGLLPTGRIPVRAVTVVGTRTLACPAGDLTTLPTTVLAGAADGIRSRLLGEGSPGTAQTYLKAPAPQAMVLSGAATLGGVSTSAMATGVYRGVWLAPCRAPAAEAWFTGVFSSATERSAVELVNVDPTQAVVDVTILGRDGRVTAPGARGLTVPANSSRVVYLEPLLTSPDPLGIQVRASEGRVAATVRMSGDAGGDWAVPTAAPSTTQVVPLVPGGDGARTLLVTNPGNRRVSVTVQVLGQESAFAPAGADSFDVNAESTLAVPLETALKGEAVGLLVTSTQPVASAVRVAVPGDFAVIGAGSPLAGDAHVPVLPGTQLGLTNAGAAVATVTVTTRSVEGGVVDSARLELGAGRSLVLPITGDRTATVQVSSDSADVRGLLTLTKSGEQSGLAVAVLGGAGGAAGASDPTLDPGLTR